MKRSFEQDAQTVKRIAKRVFGHHAYPGGIYPTDVAVNELLLVDRGEVLIPYDGANVLGMPGVRKFLAELGVGEAPGPGIMHIVSEAYVRKFRNWAIMRMMGWNANRQTVPRPTVGLVARFIKQEVEDARAGK